MCTKYNKITVVHLRYCYKLVIFFSYRNHCKTNFFFCLCILYQCSRKKTFPFSERSGDSVPHILSHYNAAYDHALMSNVYGDSDKFLSACTFSFCAISARDRFCHVISMKWVVHISLNVYVVLLSAFCLSSWFLDISPVTGTDKNWVGWV